MKRVLALLFLGGCACLGGSAAVWVPNHLGMARADSPPLGAATGTADVVRIEDRFESVARKVSPAVVYIEATKPAATKSKTEEESGSGVIIRFDAQAGFLVLTNNHVIARARPEQITVNLADGRLFHPSRVWTDPESDVALLLLDQASNLPVAMLGNSDSCRVGQWVLAIGSPFGLNQTVTHGIISARDRGQISLGSTIRIKDFLQTDAAINPGSSGGPLVNLDGEVIGINTAIASPSGNNSGVAFSIPANLVQRVVRQLLSKGSVSRGYLGLQLAGSFEPADAWKLGLDRVQGALVEHVYADTPAAQAGLRDSDVVLQVDDVAIRDENHLINLISALPAGQRVRLRVWRGKQVTNLDATVGDWSRGQARFHNSAKP